MSLITDTNILVRCSAGRAMKRVVSLADNGVSLATTEHNVVEFHRVLTDTFDVPEPAARREVERVAAAFWVLASSDYDAYREQAEQRLSSGGKSEWPALAAAISQQGSIWSDDRDFFGVGVPVWSTLNVHLAPATTLPRVSQQGGHDA